MKWVATKSEAAASMRTLSGQPSGVSLGLRQETGSTEFRAKGDHGQEEAYSYGAGRGKRNF